MPEITLEAGLRLLACFLIGAIPFAVLSMKGTGIDILKVGSGNPGFNNVLRYSKPRAVMTLFGDLGKGLAAIWLFFQYGDPVSLGWMYGLAAILGHCYSPFLRFDGGKGIATSAGVMLFLYAKLALVCLAVYAVLRVTGGKRRWLEAGTISSLAAYALFVVLLLFAEGAQMALYGAILLMFVAWRHKKNFRILLGGDEAR